MPSVEPETWWWWKPQKPWAMISRRLHGSFGLAAARSPAADADLPPCQRRGAAAGHVEPPVVVQDRRRQFLGDDHLRRREIPRRRLVVVLFHQVGRELLHRGDLAHRPSFVAECLLHLEPLVARDRVDRHSMTKSVPSGAKVIPTGLIVSGSAMTISSWNPSGRK